MNKKVLFIHLALLVALTLSSFVPAFASAESAAAVYAGKAKIRVKNKTGYPVYLTLTGSKSYNFNVVAGNSIIEIEKGDYEYSYYACGETRTGDLKKKDTELVLPSCGGGADEKTGILITFVNKTREVFWIIIEGKETYYVQAIEGKTEIYLPKGQVTYSYYACGGILFEGSIKVRSDKKIQLSCPSPSKITINHNQKNATAYITLSGPRYYTATIPSGGQSVKIEVLSGTYTYTMSVCGQYFTGKITVGPGDSVKIRPSPGKWTCISY